HCYRSTCLLPSFPTRRSSDLSVALTGRALDAHARAGPQVLLAFDDDAFARLDALHDGAFTRRVLQLDLARLRHVVLHSVDDAKEDRKSTRLNSSHLVISYAVF